MDATKQDTRSDIAMACSRLVRQVLTERNWKPARLAEELGVHPDLVRRWVRGERGPQLDDLITMADMIGASLDEIFGRRQEAEPGDLSTREVAEISEAVTKKLLGTIAVALARTADIRLPTEARAAGTGNMAPDMADILGPKAKVALEKLLLDEEERPVQTSRKTRRSA